MATICITGRLPRDCETKKTQSGTSVIEFTVPYDVGYGDKKSTVWAQCSLFGQRAEKLAQYLTKGTTVMVTGSAKPEAWLSKGGEAKCALRVNVNEIELHGSGNSVSGNKTENVSGNDTPDDEIPF